MWNGVVGGRRGIVGISRICGCRGRIGDADQPGKIGEGAVSS